MDAQDRGRGDWRPSLVILGALRLDRLFPARLQIRERTTKPNEGNEEVNEQQRLEARKDALEAELARREASRSASERQAAYVTGRGSEDERGQNAGWSSRRQASQITRRGDS
ncbi:MAG: hypothetical protein GX871_08365 [Microbacteriaceae bacterium]|nr:hypothetical protein [Microbacteriaceae bacterium]